MADGGRDGATCAARPGWGAQSDREGSPVSNCGAGRACARRRWSPSRERLGARVWLSPRGNFVFGGLPMAAASGPEGRSSAAGLSVRCTTARLIAYCGFGGDEEFAQQAVAGAQSPPGRTKVLLCTAACLGSALAISEPPHLFSLVDSAWTSSRGGGGSRSAGAASSGAAGDAPLALAAPADSANAPDRKLTRTSCPRPGSGSGRHERRFLPQLWRRGRPAPL